MTVSIADRGRKHLADALAGQMNHCLVTEWPDENGDPTPIYWRPLTGVEQQQIDQASSVVERTAMVLKVRARDAQGNLIFKDTGLTGLINDYDYDTIRAISYLITGNITHIDPEKAQADAEKE